MSALMAAAWPAPAARAQTAGFLAGTGQADVTPPLAGTAAGKAADGSQFSSCPAALFPNQGRFALQEPFNDQNGNGQWDPNVSLSGAPTGVPEPYCDTNGNGRWDGIYADNNRGPVTGVHDPIDVRAIAISDGHDRPVVYASVKAIGIFDYYTDLARTDLANTYHVDADLVVSANHNESSPDTIGLYGPLQAPGLPVGLRSGIDEYYLNFVADRIAHAAADAVHGLQPAQLYANQVQGPIPAGQAGGTYPLLSGMTQHISDQFPTSVANPSSDPNYPPGDNRVAAVDPKLGVLQARGNGGSPIFTVMSLAAHNQEMGNSGADLSGDWPGAFERAFDASHPGMAMFLVGDNGSVEDPQTSPPVIAGGSENHSSVNTQFVQAQATGQRFAQIVSGAARTAQQLTPGTVKLTRQQFCVRLENNGFLALGAAQEFGHRQGYVCDASGNPVQAVPNAFTSPNSSAQFRTFVGVTEVGPDLQMIDNPGESFPALMLGSPFTMVDESCNRPNPAVPTWHSNRLFRFQVGLADDLIGYLLPPWAFATGNTSDPQSNPPGLFSTDSCYVDMTGHRHKLESESIGPTGGADVANRLAALLDAQKDPSAHIPQGRFVSADGSYSTWAGGSAAILLPPANSTALDPSGGTLIGAPGVAGFGGRAVDATGAYMDYDGQPQAAPDVTTRGMMTFDASGCVSARYYLDVFPSLDTTKGGLGVEAGGPGAPSVSCRVSSQGGVPEIQTSLQQQLMTAGFVAPTPGGPAGRIFPFAGGCTDRTPPRSSVRARGRGRRRRLVVRHGRLRLSGRASDLGCQGHAGSVARVTVTISHRHRGRGCRYVTPAGRLTPARDCRRPLLLLAHGTTRWSLRVRLHIPRGRYRVVVGAVDAAGNVEVTRGRRANLLRLRVR
ncbi:MAG TPA: hypothetical protein VGY97_12315 [Solirubrobacteraceae bacterium]|nr:hypothetical protein [Solirubrobacteraceae bacterium]